jgi:hypothetical protein
MEAAVEAMSVPLTLLMVVDETGNGSPEIKHLISDGVEMLRTLHQHAHGLLGSQPLDLQAIGTEWAQQAGAAAKAYQDQHDPEIFKNRERLYGTRARALSQVTSVQSTRPKSPVKGSMMSGDLRSRFREPWQLGENEAEQAFQWIVEGTLPSAIPTTLGGINNLVDQITPKAMERVHDSIRERVTGPTAFPEEMFEAIEQGFRIRLTQLLIERARQGPFAEPQPEGAELGGSIGGRAELIRQEMIRLSGRWGTSPKAIESMLQSEPPAAKASDSEAWDLGLRAAEFMSSSDPWREWIASLPADSDKRTAEANHFTDLMLDPMSGANMFWATSPIADDASRYFVFAASYRRAVLRAAIASED